MGMDDFKETVFSGYNGADATYELRVSDKQKQAEFQNWEGRDHSDLPQPETLYK